MYIGAHLPPPDYHFKPMWSLQPTLLNPRSDVNDLVEIHFKEEFNHRNVHVERNTRIPLYLVERMYQRKGRMEDLQNLRRRVEALLKRKREDLEFQPLWKANRDMSPYRLMDTSYRQAISIPEEEAELMQLTFEDERYQADGPSRFLCELKAEFQNREYQCPTLDEYLHTCAQYLKDGIEPYGTQSYLITSSDHAAIYEKFMKFPLVSIAMLKKHLTDLLSPQTVELHYVDPPPSYTPETFDRRFFSLTIGASEPRILMLTKRESFRFIKE